MSNDGNKSTKRAPFTIFSSSAEGGYLTDVHTNFTGGVTLANMHTDTYGDFRNPPMQGPFTEQFVGGAPYRHNKIILAGDLEFLTPGSLDQAQGYWDETGLIVTPIDGPPSGSDTVWELSVGELTPIDVGAVSNDIWEVVDADNITPGEADPSVPYWRIIPSHRHSEGFYIVPLNSHLDIYGPNYRLGETPATTLYRDEFAKRPLNIRNIKSNSPGNYSQEYEVIQTAARTLNPRHYAEYPEQYTTDYPQHMGTEGRVFNNLDSDGNAATGSLLEYEMPDNTGSLNNFIFVNKFSAPGDRYTMSRGFLNPIGEEMSVYNANPYRNLNVREELSADLATHTPKATDIPPDLPTKYHTTNRNTRLYKNFSIDDSLKEIVDGLDNAYDIAVDQKAGMIYWTDITHDIIQRSTMWGAQIETIFNFGSGNANVKAIALDVDAGKIYWVDSVGATGKIWRGNMDGSELPEELIAIAGNSEPLGIALDVLEQKMYWTDRGADHDTVSRADMAPLATPEVLVSGLQSPNKIDIDIPGRKIYWIDEASAVIERANLDGTQVETVVTLSATWSTTAIAVDSVLGEIYWAINSNDTIWRASLEGARKEVLVDLPGTYQVAGIALATDAGQRTIFWADKTKDSIYRADMPEKPVYDDGYVTHAIPQSSLQYSWIKDSAETTRAEFQGYATGSDITFYSNSVGFSSPMNNVYIDPDTGVQSFDFSGSVYTYGSWKEIRGGELALSRYYRNHSILPVANVKDKVTQYIEPPVVAKNQPLDYVLSIDGTGAPYSIKSAYGSKLQRYSNEEINKLYDIVPSDKNTKYAEIKPLYLKKSKLDPNNPIKQFYSLTYGETVFPKSKDAFLKKARVRGKYTEVPGTGSHGYDRLYGTQNTMYKETLQRSSSALNSQGFVDISLAFDPMRTAGINSFPHSASYSGNVGELNMDTDFSLTSSSPTASLDFFEANYIRVNETSSDYNERLVEEMSGKTRWYENYEDYAENARGLIKEASILPEFRVSEHMEYYTTAGGNFRAENKNFLTLLGGDISSSANSPTATNFNVEFDDEFLSTDSMTNFKKIKEDHLGHSSTKAITLKASGVKKLLPYNGFYPDTRTVQVGNLLSQSLAPHVKGFKANPDLPTTPEEFLESADKEGLQALLKPMMSPGILYNSLKAGIGMDYPYFSTAQNPRTSSNSPTDEIYLFASTALGESWFIPGTELLESSSMSGSERLPFETLYNLDRNLPKDRRVHFAGTEPVLNESQAEISSSYQYFFKWDGNKSPLYELASHNFLAETVKFYLKDSQLNSFISAPQKSFGDVVPGRRYYMDVVLRDNTEMNKYVEYSGIIDEFPYLSSPTTYLNITASEQPVWGYPSGVDNFDASYPLVDVGRRNAIAASPDGGSYILYGTPSDAKAFLTYTSVDGETTLLETLDEDGLNPTFAALDKSNSTFGHVVSMASGSAAGLIFAVGDPTITRDVGAYGTGSMHIYRYHNNTLTEVECDTNNDTFSYLTSPYTAASYIAEGCGNDIQVISGSDKFWIAMSNTHMSQSTSTSEYSVYTRLFSLEDGWTTYNTVIDDSDSGENEIAPFSGSSQIAICEGCNGGGATTPGVVYLGIYSNTCGLTEPASTGGSPGDTPSGNSRCNFRTREIGGTFWAPCGPGLLTQGWGIASSSAGASTLSQDTWGRFSSIAGWRERNDNSPLFALTFNTYVYPYEDPNIIYIYPPEDLGSSPYGNDNKAVSKIEENVSDRAYDDGIHNESAWGYPLTVIPDYDDDNTAWLTYGDYAGPKQSATIGPLQLEVQTGRLQKLELLNFQDFAGLKGSNVVVPVDSPYVETIPLQQKWWFEWDGGSELLLLNYPWFGYSSDCVQLDDSFEHSGTFMYTSRIYSSRVGTDSVSAEYGFYSSQIMLVNTSKREASYKQHGRLFGVPINDVYDPAYAAYTPPGFYGESIATIMFSSSVEGKIPVDEILSRAEVYEFYNISSEKTSYGKDSSLSSILEVMKTQVASSLDLFSKVVEPDVQFSIGGDGTTSVADRATSANVDNTRWAISTRFESPVINNSSSLYAENYSSHIAGLEDYSGWEFSDSASFSPPRSVWTSYGEPISDATKNYSFELRQSSLFSRGRENNSLIDLCGFTAGTKQIGTPADQRDISEAIMVIPYVDRAIKNKTIQIEDGKHFFRVGKRELKKQRKNLEEAGFAIDEETPETSISEMIEAMKKYVIPPQYNFIQYDDIKPFVSYFLEFEHTLTRRDLIDIWQGVMPSIAMNPETDEVEISHNIDKHNFFYNVDIPSDIKFMIFKVKKKAEWNYYNVTTDSTDDTRFRFDFQGDGQVEVVPDYSYNWPYDYFSLVERAKVDVNFTLRKNNEGDE